MKLPVVFLLLLSFFCFADADVEDKLKICFFSPEITTLGIADWNQPTVDDLLKLQNFIKERHIRNVKRYSEDPTFQAPFPSDYLNKEFFGWLLYRSGRLSFIKDEIITPGRQVIYFNNDPNKKDKCVICYAGHQSSWNERDYIRGIHLMIKALEQTHFDGHFIYYIGGWPSLKKGRLKYIDVPFAFKPFLFEEARDLGYREVLWLDACCLPVKSLKPIFKHIRKKGLCFYSYGSLQKWREFDLGYAYLMPFLNLSKKGRYEQISSQVIGLDLSDAKALCLLNEWIKAAERKIPFLQSDEPPFMYLINQLQLQNCRMPNNYYIETPCNTGDFNYKRVNRDAIIYHQYDFIDSQYRVRVNLFSY